MLLDELRNQINYWRTRPSILRYNQPPEEFRIDPNDEDLVDADESIPVLKEELAKPESATQADPDILRSARSAFVKLAGRIEDWILGAAAAGLTLAAAGIVGGAGEELWRDPTGFLHRLEGVAATLSIWIASLGNVLPTF